MGQMTWRAPDELIDRVREVSGRQGRSMNEFVTAVLDAATNPDLEDVEAARVRERLSRAGLLAPGGAPRRRPDTKRLAEARQATRGGRELSDLIGEGRG